MYVNLSETSLIADFLSQFKEDQKMRVAQSLLVIGMDMAKKLGQQHPNELYRTLKQLSKNIENDQKHNSSSELRSEIRKIQQQLIQLNQHFNTQQLRSDEKPQHDKKGYQESHFKQRQHHHLQNRFHTQHDLEDRRELNMFQSPDSNRHMQMSMKTSKRGQRNMSPFQVPLQNVTAKITESPPPPIVYIQNVNNKFNVKPHLDDHQVKQILYNEKDLEPFDSLSSRPLHYSPKSYKYTLHLSNSQLPESHRENHHQEIPTQKKQRHRDTKSKSKGKKTLPAYLQNVESKIKNEVDQDKIAFKRRDKQSDDDQQYNQQQEEYEQYQEQMQQQIQQQMQQQIQQQLQQQQMQQQQTANFQKNKGIMISPTHEPEIYYDKLHQYDNEQTQNFKIKQSHTKLSSDKQFSNRQQNYFDQPTNINPVQVSDFQMSKQQFHEQSFDAFRKRAQQYTSPYTSQMHQNDYQVISSQKGSNQQTHQKHSQDEESSDSFSNFTPPNKEVREFFQKQFQYQH